GAGLECAGLPGVGRNAISGGTAGSRAGVCAHAEVDGAFRGAFGDQGEAVQGTREPEFFARDCARDERTNWLLDVVERVGSSADPGHRGLWNPRAAQASGEYFQLVKAAGY